MPLHTAVLRGGIGPQWLVFREPRTVVTASHPEEVIPALREVESLAARGAYAVGFVSYEAASALDPVFPAAPTPAGFPLTWFALYEQPELVTVAMPSTSDYEFSGWEPSVSLTEYRASLRHIQEAIDRGDTYQVNYTFRLRSRVRGDPWGIFLALHKAQESPYAAYLNLGRFHICSVSPELFFCQRNGLVLCKPMKGTAKRGCTEAEDRVQQEQLHSSAKNRAENVMIVDMVRNDLGKIATPSTVNVAQLFAVEKYPTLLQMTSTVSAQARAPLTEVFRALFPSASVTGAPKIKTVRIIRALEREPRGLYTGAIGHIAPNGDRQFSVAIRTLVIDTDRQAAEYGTGSGIVADSNADDEYAECELKARVLLHSMRTRTAGALR
jgi:para-aminobenzoate synthetase/4-amino-4-deoxychorismate lyase